MFPPVVKTEEDYAGCVLVSLEEAHAFFLGNKSKYFTESYPASLHRVFRIFQQMYYIDPPLYSEDYVVPSDPLLYRKPIWKLLEDVLLQEVSFTLLRDQKERAQKFMEVISLAAKYTELKKLIANFSVEAKKVGFDVEGVNAPVSIILDSELTGKNAYNLAIILVPKMLQDVEGFLESKS